MPTTHFTKATWKRLVATIASGFAMDKERAAAFEANATAKLIGALPYLALCREPERCAVAHLAAFVIGGAKGSARELFDHRESDNYDVFARLSVLGSFEGGDPAIINRGMKLLAIVMIAGYKKDAAADKAAGRYNPVAAGVWKADALIATLTASVEASPNPEMDAILDVKTAVKGFWEE
jgi:hypothetical protein